MYCGRWWDCPRGRPKQSDVRDTFASNRHFCSPKKVQKNSWISWHYHFKWDRNKAILKKYNRIERAGVFCQTTTVKEQGKLSSVRNWWIHFMRLCVLRCHKFQAKCFFFQDGWKMFSVQTKKVSLSLFLLSSIGHSACGFTWEGDVSTTRTFLSVCLSRPLGLCTCAYIIAYMELPTSEVIVWVELRLYLWGCVCACVCVFQRKTKDKADGMMAKVPIPSTGFEPVPLGFAPIVLMITPWGQARLASVETNTSYTHLQVHRETQSWKETLQLLSAGRDVRHLQRLLLSRTKRVSERRNLDRSVCVCLCVCVCACVHAQFPHVCCNTVFPLPVEKK